jgi:hypothetical protein
MIEPALQRLDRSHRGQASKLRILPAIMHQQDIRP